MMLKVWASDMDVKMVNNMFRKFYKIHFILNIKKNWIQPKAVIYSFNSKLLILHFKAFQTNIFYYAKTLSEELENYSVTILIKWNFTICMYFKFRAEECLRFLPNNSISLWTENARKWNKFEWIHLLRNSIST